MDYLIPGISKRQNRKTKDRRQKINNEQLTVLRVVLPVSGQRSIVIGEKPMTIDWLDTGLDIANCQPVFQGMFGRTVCQL